MDCCQREQSFCDNISASLKFYEVTTATDHESSVRSFKTWQRRTKWFFVSPAKVQLNPPANTTILLSMSFKAIFCIKVTCSVENCQKHIIVMFSTKWGMNNSSPSIQRFIDFSLKFEGWHLASIYCAKMLHDQAGVGIKVNKKVACRPKFCTELMTLDGKPWDKVNSWGIFLPRTQYSDIYHERKTRIPGWNFQVAYWGFSTSPQHRTQPLQSLLSIWTWTNQARQVQPSLRSTPWWRPMWRLTDHPWSTSSTLGGRMAKENQDVNYSREDRPLGRFHNICVNFSPLCLFQVLHRLQPCVQSLQWRERSNRCHKGVGVQVKRWTGGILEGHKEMQQSDASVSGWLRFFF